MKQNQSDERYHISLTGSEPVQVHIRIHMYLFCPLKWHYNLRTFLFCFFFFNKVVYYKNILMPVKFISSKILIAALQAVAVQQLPNRHHCWAFKLFVMRSNIAMKVLPSLQIPAIISLW